MKTALSLTCLALLSCSAADRPQPMQGVELSYLKPAESRSFSIEYVGKISDIPPGTKKLRVWIPVPQNTSVQAIRGLEFSRPPVLATEPKYGNRIACWEIDDPGAAVEVSMKFGCTRREIRTDLALLKTEGSDAPDAFSVFKGADSLVLVDDEIRKLSDEVTRGRSGALDKARAIYDYVLGKMTYDKSHTGWGLGSTKHACEIGKGNCTDFHAKFIGIGRAAGIPVRFTMGVPLSGDAKGLAGGYHCWAHFHDGAHWIPVDVSEAQKLLDKDPAKAAWFFGNLDPDRVTLSVGRDVTLAPKQQGPALLFFIYPHVEVDGKKIDLPKEARTFAFENVGS